MVRFICQSCGVKWFVAPGSREPEPDDCAACGGPLAVLEEDEPPDDAQAFGPG
jgi:hypothetical protein